MTRAAALLLTVLLTACGAGGSLDDDIAGLQASLDAKDFAAVVSGADAVLDRCKADGADASRSWRVESMRIKALARSGQGTETAEKLEAAADAYEGKVSAKLYAQMGNYCMEADDNSGAIAVLDVGMKRFPDNAAALNAQIDALKAKAAASGDSETLKQLEQLGYL